MAIPELLRELLRAIGPTGYEHPAAAVWRAAAAEFATVERDSLGNSFARLAAPEGAPRLVLVGHIDEIGLLVTHIDDEGLLAFTTLGGIAAETLSGQRVLLSGRAGIVPGVIGRREGEGRGEHGRVGHSDLHIDLGVASREQAAALVDVGDAGVWAGEPVELGEGRIVSRALDNRLGAYVVLEAARRVAAAGDARCELVAVAAVQEEIGHHGARTAVYGLDAAVALVVDVTPATDVPGGDPRRAGAIALGSGAALARGPVANPCVVELLVELAQAEGIAHTFEALPAATRTDADAVHISRAGVPTGIVSIPLRYIHTPNELATLADLEAVIALVVAFARRIEGETSYLR